MNALFSRIKTPFVIFTLLAASSLPALAHCDTMNGPVVVSAREALKSGDITPVLKWVRPQDENELRAAFALARSARGQGAESRELADRYFFETAVRIHRGGEGMPYTGLKTAPPEPGIAAADRALDTGNIDELVEHATRRVADDIRQRYARVREAQKHANESVAAGREFVEAYVAFIHYVEALDASPEAAHSQEHAGQ